MTKDIAILNRQGMALFNFMRMKHQNDKRIGDLTVDDFIEMCKFLTETENKNANN
jgi:hypothetical protein